MDDKNLAILIRAAKAGGEILRNYFGETLSKIQKSTAADFQTKADVEAEQEILAILKQEFPDYNIFSEEEGKTNKNSEYEFVIDPMDGTHNFITGIPNFAVSIALLCKNEPVMSVVYNPIIDQMYSAIKGKGTYLNGTIIKVNDIVDSKLLTVGLVFGYKSNRPYVGNVFKALYDNDSKRVLFSWSLAYDCCLLASGKIESIINDGSEIYDYAAGKLIALEAGAKIIDFTGKSEKEYTNNKFIMSNTDEVNKYVLNILASLQKDR